MEKSKLVYESPPLELVNSIEYIESFKTQKIANGLWSIGERCLKKENLWPNFFNFNTPSELEYYLVFGDPLFAEYCKIGYEKKNFKEDEMKFNYVTTGGINSSKNEFVLLKRGMFTPDLDEDNSGFIKKILKRNIWQIIAVEDKG